MLECGLSAFQRNQLDQLPIHLACVGSHLEIVKYFVGVGFDFQWELIQMTMTGGVGKKLILKILNSNYLGNFITTF